ncbi:hypothetical protein [Croceicoccus bisphenolivorans]|uniref:hypothetical protein n=1 Tax=Croceicoccus bisphenolivorans TaxID=1783232 RepID=UPI0008316AA1|nr:hypothetical protein [Croceicoccus bisphenolivorans]
MGELEKATGLQSIMRVELKRGDRVLSARGVVLRQLIATEDRSMFSDAIVARVRAMAEDMARQVGFKLAQAAGEKDPRVWAESITEPLSGALIDEPVIVDHLHAVALEWQLTESMQRRAGVDPSLSPLLQALIGADDPTSSALAMDLLTSQAAFARHQQRMSLPVVELPAEVLHALLETLRHAVAGDLAYEAHARNTEHAIREEYDESQCRISLANRLVTALGAGAFAALSITHAGVAVFLSALASATSDDRDTVAVATSESQLARLALSLRAAGLSNAEIEREFYAIHPDITLPDGFGRLHGNDARALLTGQGAGGDGRG